MINETVRRVIDERGITQKWLIGKMNAISPGLDMTKQKMSAIMTDRRKLTCDEFLAFCRALEINPDYFIQSA